MKSLVQIHTYSINVCIPEYFYCTAHIWKHGFKFSECSPSKDASCIQHLEALYLPQPWLSHSCSLCLPSFIQLINRSIGNQNGLLSLSLVLRPLCFCHQNKEIKMLLICQNIYAASQNSCDMLNSTDRRDLAFLNYGQFACGIKSIVQ